MPSATVCDVDISAAGAYGKAFECGVKEDGGVVEFFAHVPCARARSF